MSSMISNWKNSGSKSTAVHRLGRNHTTKREEYHDERSNNSNKWLMFWRRLGGKKKKNSDDPSFYMPKRYDPESYLLNFDEGLGRVKQDNFFRYMEEADGSTNNSRSTINSRRLGKLIRENNDFFGLITSTFLTESRYSVSIQAATIRLLFHCSQTWTPSVRKQHNAGYKHKANIRAYYQKFEEQQTQILIDQKIKEHLGQAAVYQQIGAAYNQHLTGFPGGRPRIPFIPPPMLPIPRAVAPHSAFGIRPPVLPTHFPVASGYAATQMEAPVTMQPPTASSLPVPPSGVPILTTMIAPSPISGAEPPPSSNGVQSATTQSTYEFNPSATAASLAMPTAGVYSYAQDSRSSH